MKTLKLEEFLKYYRDLGMLDFYEDPISEAIVNAKSGSKIKIKKENRGSFTRWCGGKVTEECI
jgi:hypothetical protein